jgi:type VI secretion system protein VasJ
MNLLSLGKDPINPDQPTGTDVRYEPEFEKIHAEIDKLSSPSSSGGIDWQKVGETSAFILAEKSKDLLVGSYLAVSQIHTRQIEGLTVGLTVMHDLINEFWDTLFPPKKRMRGRLGAIEWWIEKTNSALKNIKPEPLADEKLKELNEALTRIDSTFKEYFPDPHNADQADTHPLLISIQRFIEVIPSLTEEKPTTDPLPPVEENTVFEPPATDERSQPEAPSEPETEPSRNTVKPETLSIAQKEIETEKDAQKIIDQGFQKLHQAASFLLTDNPMNPVAYRYRRIASWSKVSVLPQHTGTKTQIPPPAPYILQPLFDLSGDGNWSALLESAEQKLSQFIFWIDLNRFVAEALINLGKAYQEAHEAVCQETAFFMHRLPGLDTLAFSDGMPFADPETKPWLKSIEFGTGSTVMEQIQVTGFDRDEGGEDPMTETIEKARLLLKREKIVESITLIQQKVQNSFSQKEALSWRLVLCQILLDSKNKDMTLPHIEQILEDIESYRLETWDPQLALKGLKVAWTGFNSFSDKSFKHNATQTLNRIAKLDPAEALRLNK